MDNILEALKQIDVAKLSYQEWINIGMALKAEGFSVDVWDSWSRNDTRYKAGECERKWRTFSGSSNPVGAGTIVQMAKDSGWTPHYFSGDGTMEWNDVIEYDGDGVVYAPRVVETPVEQLIKYLKILFKDDEYVSYVATDVYQDKDGKWVPGKGYCDRTASELIEELKKHPCDIGAVIGDTKKECGAWIRFNPVDGKGAKNENVTRFTYALVESDDMPIAEQDALYRKLELPIACLVHSGGKSLHAIVRVDASDEEEYRKRVTFLYDYLEKQGMNLDKSNRNPSRLSRMPGVTRNGVMQTLVDTNIGRKSYIEWLDFAEGIDDELAGFDYPVDLMDDRPPLAPELLSGLFRVGHKMIVQGASKSAKSWFLIELGISIAEGLSFLDFNSKKSKVLYINLEIDRPSCLNRIFTIYEAFKITKPTRENFVVWNLRGHAMPLDKLVPIIIRRVRSECFNAIIIDPIYKVITGDENNASEMGAFCNQFDKLCDATGCSVIYAHHHSKGTQGWKDAQDRSSGSSVFSRDPDTIIDLTRLDLSQEVMNKVADSDDDTAWLMTCITRDFKQPKPRKIWFKYPCHVLDETGALNNSFTKGDPRNNLKQNRNASAKSNDEKEEMLLDAFEVISMGRDEIPIRDFAEYLAEGSEKEKIENKRRELYRWFKKIKALVLVDGMVKRNPNYKPENE